MLNTLEFCGDSTKTNWRARAPIATSSGSIVDPRLPAAQQWGEASVGAVLVQAYVTAMHGFSSSVMPYLTSGITNVVRQANEAFVHKDDLSAKFHSLASIWKSETAAMSSVSDITNHPAYKHIVMMGISVVPLLLRELDANPNYWFQALREITGVDPARRVQRGNLRKMAHAWVQWGRTNNLI